MFNEFSGAVQVKALTLSAVQRITGLDWNRVEIDAPAAKSTIPTETGVYLWVNPEAPQCLRYHGSGTGADGLRGRLSGQLTWRSKQLARQKRFRDDDQWVHGWERAEEVPVVRAVAEDRLELWTAVARPATWCVPSWAEPSGLQPPENALEWETFISEASRLAVGHRGIVGGGAWENKRNTLGDRMCHVAWYRLVEVADNCERL